jgi:alpha-L-rhamnosidase
VDYVGTRAKDEIVSFGLGDWAPAKTHTPPAITSTAYYYVDAVLLSKMAGICGIEEDRKTYADLAGRIKDAINRHYYRGKGIYGEQGKGLDDAGSQTSLACALYQGLGDANLRETVDALVAAVHKNDDHLDCGILGTKYLLHALSDNGRADLAYKIVNQHSFPGWGYWIDQGATTLWEQWNGTESRNHIMFGDVSAWFYETLAGIAPDVAQPGFKRIIFHPYFAPELTWVKASHQSPYGEISAEWRRKGGHVYYKISIPANTTGEVILPGGKKISIDGKSRSANKIILGSGSYTIKIK